MGNELLDSLSATSSHNTIPTVTPSSYRENVPVTQIMIVRQNALTHADAWASKLDEFTWDEYFKVAQRMEEWVLRKE